MPRRNLVLTDRVPYHVYNRSNNREWFYLALEKCWELLCEKAAENSALFGTEFHSLVLMANHLHMILSTPRANLGLAMRHFFTELAKGILRYSDRTNHVFGGRYRWTLLESANSVAYCTKYVLRNPVRAGICSRPEDYRFSSLYLRNTFLPPVTEGLDRIWRFVPRNFDERLQWLNQPTKKENEDLIRAALRREKFQFTKSSNAQKALRELHSEYGVPFDLT